MIPRSFTLRLGALKCPTNRIYPPSRTFSSLTVRLAKSQPRKPLSKPTTPPRNPSSNSQAPLNYKFMGRRPEGLGKFEQKVIHAGRISLFEAPSQGAYVFGAYGISAFCFAYAVINSSMNIGENHAFWLKGAYFGMCVVMSTLGTVFFSRTSKLIRKITAISSADGVKLLVDVRSMVPFRKPYTIETTPRQMVFARKLVVDPRRTTPDGKLRPRTTQQVSFLKNPSKAINYKLFQAFFAFRRIFSQEEMILVEFDGQKGSYRMDSNGYISDDMFAIGAPVKPQK
ncbi:hypothetical protein PISL3812_05356 [Talaromyces islandicus]|uniref:Uncharacterized protein n=1 Tax=Talaromyces islandicus TaxID=28573 RepID=A0A0U1LYB3_TALIS|nr:hypothetical protein PISL3812_05356 [Talaromyces islandicus]